MLAAEVDLIACAVQGEPDGAFGRAAVQVIDEQGLYFLGHRALRSCIRPRRTSVDHRRHHKTPGTAATPAVKADLSAACRQRGARRDQAGQGGSSRGTTAPGLYRFLCLLSSRRQPTLSSADVSAGIKHIYSDNPR